MVEGTVSDTFLKKVNELILQELSESKKDLSEVQELAEAR